MPISLFHSDHDDDHDDDDKNDDDHAYLIFVTNITNGVCGEKICHVEKIFHMTNCHVEKFLHMTNIQLEICLYMVNKEKNHVMWRNVE